MKLQNFLQITKEFLQANNEKITKHAQNLKKAGGYNDFNTRLAFDCFYFHKHEITKAEREKNPEFYFQDWICELCGLDKNQGINDAYIGTLYKKALKDCGIL